MDHALVPLPYDERALVGELEAMIASARWRASVAVNSELVMLYWNVGRRIREHILDGKRAEYGAATLKRVAAELSLRHGRGFGWRNLFRMVRFVELYPDSQILPTVSAILSWSHLVEILRVDDAVERDFYVAFCAHERWSVRTLRAQIAGKLFERTVAARGTLTGLPEELAGLRDARGIGSLLVFRDPYVLDFLGLPARHSEADLEQGILDEMQRFLIELGADFAFVARQKRIVVDDRDYYLDLLFYHRGLRALVAIELKARALEPGDYGQTRLYLRWLDKHERRPGEESPIGLILCAEKGPEQTALLGLDDGEIRAAQYLTEPLRAEMQRRLAAARRAAR